MKRRLTRKLLLVSYSVISVLVLLEVGVRIAGYSEHHISDPIYVDFPQAPDIPYVLKPNLSNARARGLALINTDSLGLRSVASGGRYDRREKNEFRIAIVGDSVTFGEGVPKTEDTYPQILEQVLNQSQSFVRVRVFNFGASAYNVKVMKATLDSRMPAVAPDLVLMAIIPADFNLNRTPAPDVYGYLSDRKLSSFLSSDSRVRLWLRKLHSLYLIRDTIYPLVDNSQRAELVLAAGGLPESYSYVQQFKELAEQRGIAYRVVLLPSWGGQFYGLQAQMQQDGIATVDLSSLSGQYTLDQFRASRWDGHPSALVHKRIGELLAAYILENHLLPGRDSEASLR